MAKEGFVAMKWIFWSLLFFPISAASSDGLAVYERLPVHFGISAEVRGDAKSGYQTWIVKPGSSVLTTQTETSFPPPRAGWISNDLLRVDYGSALGADIRSYFYSASRNVWAGPYEFVAAVDADAEIMFRAADALYLGKLFSGNTAEVELRIENLNTAALKWFVISQPKFRKGFLTVTYMTDGDQQEWRTQRFPLPDSLR